MRMDGGKRLLILQMDAKIRHSKYVIKIKPRKFKKVTPKTITRKIIGSTKIVEKPAPHKKWVAEPPVHADEKKPIVRPPAIYTNNPSPYGIADELRLK